MKILIRDLGDNPVLTLWEDLIEGLPYAILIAGFCFLVMYLSDEYSNKLGSFGYILTFFAFICSFVLYALGLSFIGMIFSIIINFIFSL